MNSSVTLILKQRLRKPLSSSKWCHFQFSYTKNKKVTELRTTTYFFWDDVAFTEKKQCFFNSKTKDNNRTQYCIPGPSKGCHMVPKGCQFTIPYGSIGTPWKVLVGWPGYRVTTPTISHTIRVGQTGQPWVGDEKPSRQNSWMEMKMSNGEYEPSSNFCITEFSVLQLDIYIYTYN